MSTNFPIRRIAARWLVFLALLSCGLPAQRTIAAPENEPSQLWRDLLEAALGKTGQDKALVQEIAELPPGELEGDLAKLLLEEWDLPSAAEELQRPRVIAAPKPDYSDLVGEVQLKSAVVAATGQVTPLGMVENLELKIGSGIEEVDQRCLEAFSRWRYRPALGDCGYVRSTVAATCHVHPR